MNYVDPTGHSAELPKALQALKRFWKLHNSVSEQAWDRVDILEVVIGAHSDPSDYTEALGTAVWGGAEASVAAKAAVKAAGSRVARNAAQKAVGTVILKGAVNATGWGTFLHAVGVSAEVKSAHNHYYIDEFLSVGVLVGGAVIILEYYATTDTEGEVPSSGSLGIVGQDQFEM